MFVPSEAASKDTQTSVPCSASHLHGETVHEVSRCDVKIRAGPGGSGPPALPVVIEVGAGDGVGALEAAQARLRAGATLRGSRTFPPYLARTIASKKLKVLAP